MKNKIKKNPYYKPTIKVKKIALNFFASHKNDFNTLNGMIGENIYLAVWGCIVKGNTILMHDNSLKKVEDIEKGDFIRAWDINENVIAKSKVVDIELRHEEHSFVIINDKLQLTPNHRIWINTSEWKRSDDISVGDTVIDHLGKEMKVTKIELVNQPVTTYNIRIDGDLHNYFVEDILIHE